MEKNKKVKKIILLIIFILLFLCSGYIIFYVNTYYHAKDVEGYLEDSDTVKISKIDDGYIFDGPGDKNALVFYPGAKVEDKAYAPILNRLARNGVDCFLVHMPCNLAIFGVDKADNIINSYSYDSWYIAGHSLGGAMAANYAYKNSQKLNGLILLAAYSTKDISKSNLNVKILYGSKDCVLNREKMENSRSLLPNSFKQAIINGGNHALFGSYGKQKGDGEALITQEEQWNITVNEILETINNN